MLKGVQVPLPYACPVVAVGITKGTPMKEQEFQVLLSMKIGEHVGTGRWESGRLTSVSILPTYIEHLLCARPLLGTREKT